MLKELGNINRYQLLESPRMSSNNPWFDRRKTKQNMKEITEEEARDTGGGEEKDAMSYVSD